LTQGCASTHGLFENVGSLCDPKDAPGALVLIFEGVFDDHGRFFKTLADLASSLIGRPGE
jgi:hypothetical protein